MKKAPLVSVVMPVYNGAQYIAEAIESVLGQRYRHFELLIVDDGSTDDTGEVIARYRDERIRLIVQESNRGLIHSRSNAIAGARGEYIAFLDSDDTACPTRLAKQVAFLESNPDYAMVGAWADVIDEQGRLTGRTIRYRAAAELIPSLLLFHNGFAQSAIVVRKNCLPSDPYGAYSLAEDYALWIILARRSKVANLQEALVRYRLHPGSTSARMAQEMELCVCRIIKENLERLGITASAADIVVHRALEKTDSGISRVLLAEIEQWLLRLRAANRSNAIYDSRCFERVLGEKWFSACRASSPGGLVSFLSYIRSPLCARGQIPLRKTGVFFLRCVFRVRRRREKP